MSRRRYELVPMLAIPLLTLAIAAPALASSAARDTGAAAMAGAVHRAATPTAQAGFVHFGSVTGPTTSYSSNGQPVTINSSRPGETQVIFPGLLRVDHAEVSASGGSPGAFCSVPDIIDVPAANPTGVEVTVLCSNTAGDPATLDFDLLVTAPVLRPAGVFDDVRVGPATTVVSQFNSAGKHNSVSHPGLGVYNITMPGSGSAGNDKGTVKVSYATDESGNCQIGSWTATKKAQKINVRCFDGKGNPTDEDFLVTYVRGNNLMAQNGLIDANAKVQAVGRAPVYQPATQFNSKRGARVTAAHLDRGQYLVFFAGSSPTGKPNGGDGNIQITPIGTQDRHCGYKLFRTRTPKLEVTCTDISGKPRDTAFTVQWVIAGN
jgi:hypothetical protein